jgi:hypothetical protein
MLFDIIFSIVRALMGEQEATKAWFIHRQGDYHHQGPAGAG